MISYIAMTIDPLYAVPLVKSFSPSMIRYNHPRMPQLHLNPKYEYQRNLHNVSMTFLCDFN